MSGYPEKAIHQDDIMPWGTSFLSKPFSYRTLSDKVRGMLDAMPA